MDGIVYAFLGAVAGFLCGAVVTADYTNKNADELKAQCESELPRNQQCVMYFKPEVSE